MALFVFFHMQVLQLDPTKDTTDAVVEIVNVLRHGGTVVCPTDTLYGIAANALDVHAVRRVFNIKKRSFSKPLPILARSRVWVDELAHVPARHEGILEKVWPGKVTVVLPKKEIVPDLVTAGHQNIGIRIANYPFLDAVLARYGYPLTMTSANISGQDSSQRIDDIIAAFFHEAYKPDIIVDVGTLPSSEPSTLLDLTTDKPKILRVGAATPDQLMKLLQINS